MQIITQPFAVYQSYAESSRRNFMAVPGVVQHCVPAYGFLPSLWASDPDRRRGEKRERRAQDARSQEPASLSPGPDYQSQTLCRGMDGPSVVNVMFYLRRHIFSFLEFYRKTDILRFIRSEQEKIEIEIVPESREKSSDAA